MSNMFVGCNTWLWVKGKHCKNLITEIYIDPDSREIGMAASVVLPDIMQDGVNEGWCKLSVK